MVLEYYFENNSKFNYSCFIFFLKVTLLSHNNQCDICSHCIQLRTWLGVKNSALLHDSVDVSGETSYGEELEKGL